jgi:hypothetical protein
MTSGIISKGDLGAGAMAEVVECLLNKCKVLSPTPVPPPHQKKKGRRSLDTNAYTVRTPYDVEGSDQEDASRND